MAKVDFRYGVARNAMEYAKRADFYALICKGGNTTPVKVITAEGMQESLKTCRDSFQQTCDGIRWKGLQANKARVCGLVKVLEIKHNWKDFPLDSEYFKATAHEKEVTEELNRVRFLGHTWIHSGRTYDNSGEYVPDVVSEDGTLTIEVKGVHGRLFGV